MKLSVVVPVFNERKTIKDVYERIRAVDINKEIILVDDNSTDGAIIGVNPTAS
jgi:glycosyltransferase involved in cell wall biosynthesis